MIASLERKASRVAGFRTKLLVAMMLIVSAITGLALYYAQRNLAANVEEDLQREFQSALTLLHNDQEIRLALLVERCRALGFRSRIQSPLEDGALDLLYPNAETEMHDVMQGGLESSAGERAVHTLRAEFYRFLDLKGAVIPADDARNVGALQAEEEAQLALSAPPDEQQLGYLRRKMPAARGEILEIIAMPIISTGTGEVIAGLVLGFKPFELPANRAASGMKSGIWLNGQLNVPGLSAAAAEALAGEMGRLIATPGGGDNRLRVVLDGAPHQIFYKRLNPGARFPAGYEVCIYPLTGLAARQQQLRWQVLGTGSLLLLGALIASFYVAGKLSSPVEKLAVESEEQHAQRVRAEAALELTHEELQRSARFSADASHQLKTPVSVLRAGLEELLARENLAAEDCHAVSALIHQTYRLSSLIEDLLLLSRMDAGHLKLDFAPVNLSQLIEGALDDLGALPDGWNLRVETEFPLDLQIAGEKNYTTIILQNLLENARKYNHRGGRIRITAREENGMAMLTVGNTGRAIAPAAQAHIFERFHRGAIGENVPGYGLGLNLARELARLHHGDLRLARSAENWTEFEVRFQLASSTTLAARSLS